MLLLGIYLISFMVVWYVYLHKLPPIGVYAQQSKSSILYTIIKIVFNIVYTMCINYGFIRFHYVQNKGLCSFSCQNLSNYTKISPPYGEKTSNKKTFPCFVYNTQKYLQWDFFRPTPYYIVPLKNYYLYYHKFIHIKFYTRDKILIVGLKKSHSYIKAFIL